MFWNLLKLNNLNLFLYRMSAQVKNLVHSNMHFFLIFNFNLSLPRIMCQIDDKNIFVFVISITKYAYFSSPTQTDPHEAYKP